MSAQTRTIRLDLSTALYAPLEHYALDLDVGVSDLVRRLIVTWADEHPLPDGEKSTP